MGCSLRNAIAGAAGFYSFVLFAEDLAANDVFKPPDVLCSALDTMGVRTGAWRPTGNAAGPGVRVLYTCEYRSSDDRPVSYEPPGTNAPGWVFLYRVSGTAVNSADHVSLSVTIRDPDSKAEAKERFLEGLEAVFAAIRRDCPRGLAASVGNERRYRFREPTVRSGSLF
jgi:hypothetical protein